MEANTNRLDFQQAKTWGELAQMLGHLSKEQRDEPLNFWDESSSGKATVIRLREDHYNDGEFIEPRSSYDDESIKNATLVYKAGSLIIDIDK